VANHNKKEFDLLVDIQRNSTPWIASVRYQFVKYRCQSKEIWYLPYPTDAQHEFLRDRGYILVEPVVEMFIERGQRLNIDSPDKHCSLDPPIIPFQKTDSNSFEYVSFDALGVQLLDSKEIDLENNRPSKWKRAFKKIFSCC
jgi:hypothetical protein